MIKLEKLSEKIAKIISIKIIFDELKSNETIYETQLAKEWEVSRSPVRDALQWLAQKRLVEKTEKGNYRVIEITPQYIEKFYDTLNMLYGYTLARATKYVTDKDLEAISILVDHIDESVKSKNYEDYLKYVSIYGQRVLKIARNPIIDQTAYDLMLVSKRIMHKAISISPLHLKTASKYARQSYDCLLNSEPEKVKQSFQKFTNASMTVLLESINDSNTNQL